MNPFATSLTFYLVTLPVESMFWLNTHINMISFFPRGRNGGFKVFVLLIINNS